jgi:hypothetical protein
VPLKIVNSAPGKSDELAQPGSPLHLGLRSSDDQVVLGTFRASLGYSNIRNHGTLPESDLGLFADVSLHSVEFLEPQGATALVSLSDNDLLITKTAQNDFERGVYSVRCPVTHDASVLGYFKFKRKSWTPIKPDWCWLDNMVGLFFGLRFGYANTACYAFLQDDDANGQLVVTGPLGDYRSQRPGPDPVFFDWKNVDLEESLELLIFVNGAGEPDVNPPNEATYEVWAKTSTGAWRVGPYPLSTLTQDRRRSSDNYAELFFGNAGTAGDVLELEDWVLYPDYRLAVRDGIPLPQHSFSVAPDVPLVFRAAQGKSPIDNYPGRWFISPDGVPPVVGYAYQPGQGAAPQLVTLEKQSSSLDGQILPVQGKSTLEREEPRLSSRREGFMIEAFMSSDPQYLEGDVFGSGIAVDDGLHIFRVVTLQDALRKSIGLQKRGHQDSFEGYIEPGDTHDFTTLTLVRLTVDRARNKVSVLLDDSPSVETSLSDTEFPDSEAHRGLVKVGHVLDNKTLGSFGLSSLLFLPDYRSFEAIDGLAPDAIRHAFTRSVVGAGASGVADGLLSIDKPDFASVGTSAIFSRVEPVDELHGAFVEFQTSIPFYTDQYGTPLGKRVDTGVGVRLFMGNKKLIFGFFDCGIYGRRVGIVPGSGAVKDILDQTPLGQRVSARCDWSQKNTIRIVIRPFDKLEVWIGPVTNDPAIVLPWRGVDLGFDFPADFSAARIEFGHFDDDTSSSSYWSFFRWCLGTGYDVTFSQSYPDGEKQFHFGGEMLYRADFEDSGHEAPPT